MPRDTKLNTSCLGCHGREASESGSETAMSSVTTEDLRVRPAEAPVPSPTPTVPNNHVIVLFGATGDLAKRKLLPGMFHLAEAGLMPERFIVIGASRSEMEDGEFAAL